MNTTAAYSAAPAPIRGLRRVEAWLDQRGKWAWIAAMVAGFVLFWPVGLALLFYMIWGKQMFGHSCRHRGQERGHDRSHHGQGWGRAAFRTTGNAAFDSYKAETLKRLEDEQEAFESFLQRLREARDKSEFDNFMDERARTNRAADTVDTAADTTAAARPAEAEAETTGEMARRGQY